MRIISLFLVSMFLFGNNCFAASKSDVSFATYIINQFAQKDVEINQAKNNLQDFVDSVNENIVNNPANLQKLQSGLGVIDDVNLQDLQNKMNKYQRAIDLIEDNF